MKTKHLVFAFVLAVVANIVANYLTYKYFGAMRGTRKVEP